MVKVAFGEIAFGLSFALRVGTACFFSVVVQADLL